VPWCVVWYSARWRSERGACSSRLFSSTLLTLISPNGDRTLRGRQDAGTLLYITTSGPRVFVVCSDLVDCNSRVPFRLFSSTLLTLISPTCNGDRTLRGRQDTGTLLYITTSGPRVFVVCSDLVDCNSRPSRPPAPPADRDYGESNRPPPQRIAACFGDPKTAKGNRNPPRLRVARVPCAMRWGARFGQTCMT
jgi:hypothetical protein